jgi:hypothetical protein
MRRRAAADAGAAANSVRPAATRVLMTASAAFLGALGACASFLPREILAHAASPGGSFAELMIQLAGAAWIAFAAVNWSARGNLLGGIYGRPIALGNFALFAIGAITLLKNLSDLRGSAILLVVAVVYSAFAACFGYVLFGAGPVEST